MNDPLIWARAIHFIATAMVAGVFLFAAFVAEPAFRKASPDGHLVVEVRRWLRRIAWLGLIVALISGTAWLLLTAEEMSDRPLAGVLSEGIIGTVLARTGFGHAWLVRFALAGLLAGLLWTSRSLRTGLSRISAAFLAAAFVGMLAWAGHAVGTPGVAGGIHLTADVLHLVGAAAWVGALVPLALLLRSARVDQDESSLQVAQIAVSRFSTLGIVSVALILTSGIVNAWYLAGSAPALFGTDYGRLLLGKVALFLLMVSVAAVNRFQLTPRLAQAAVITKRDALRRLARNSAIEAAAGATILLIVAVLGTLPPGLHQQPTWPFSFRISGGVFGEPDLYIAILFGAAWIAAGISYRQLRWPAIAIGVAIYVLEGFRLPIIEAYPTTFYGSPNGFSTQSIASGEDVFVAQCASCHGPEGRGDGPAGASLTTKPADLTADHVYEHTDGDLFWWISHGFGTEMPAFGDLLDENARWSLIDFIRANADATRLRAFGTKTIAAFPTPVFSVQCPQESTISIDQLRPQIVHMVIAGSGLDDRLREVAGRDVTDKLRTVLIATHPEAENPLCTANEPETIKAFALYTGNAAVEGTEFLVDPAGNLRSMWHADDSVNGDTSYPLERRVQDLRIAPRVQRPSSLQGHTHTH